MSEINKNREAKNMVELKDEWAAAFTGGLGARDNAAVKSVQASRENLAAVCGAGLEKPAAGLKNKAVGVPTITAYCSNCGKNTEFYTASGARGKCSECGMERML